MVSVKIYPRVGWRSEYRLYTTSRLANKLETCELMYLVND